jgi:hypothetical protein
MRKRAQSPRNAKQADPETIRASISFPADLYAALEADAKRKKVSLAWIVRDAAEQYLSNKPSADLKEVQR